MREGFFVELVGLEPTSKQAAKMPSTCLAFSWGFGFGPGKGGPILSLSFFVFRPCTEALQGLARLLMMFPQGRGQAWLPGKQTALNSFY